MRKGKEFEDEQDNGKDIWQEAVAIETGSRNFIARL
jgi:hypothetical protein